MLCVVVFRLSGSLLVTLQPTGTFSAILDLTRTLIFSVTLELIGTFSAKVLVAGTVSVVL
jgi:hypothetical protein